MAKFIVRIGFHNTGNKSFYERAKNEIAKDGFNSEITLKNKLVQLPVGEFFIEGQYTISQIIDKAKKAASTLDQEFSILVSEIHELDGYNLLPSFGHKRH